MSNPSAFKMSWNIASSRLFVPRVESKLSMSFIFMDTQLEFWTYFVE